MGHHRFTSGRRAPRGLGLTRCRLASGAVVTDASALDLTGKVAVVTGAARGIGKSLAYSLEACGAQLALCDRLGDLMTETAKGFSSNPLVSILDVRDLDAVNAFIAEIKERYGRVDILINNAGGGFYASVMDVSAGRPDSAGQRELHQRHQLRAWLRAADA